MQASVVFTDYFHLIFNLIYTKRLSLSDFIAPICLKPFFTKSFGTVDHVPCLAVTLFIFPVIGITAYLTP